MSLGDDSAASKVCKITLLQQLVYRGNYDVLCETWLNNFVMDCELLYGYFLFQRDREGRMYWSLSKLTQRPFAIWILRVREH